MSDFFIWLASIEGAIIWNGAWLFTTIVFLIVIELARKP